MLKEIWRDDEIWALAVAETIVWAGTYYIFAALISHWEADLGWTKTELAIGFTSGLIISGLLAPVVGRLIDRGFGRQVLIGGAALGGCALLLMAQVEHQWQFVSVWVLIGVSAASCYYEPCFSYITHTRGLNAKGAITLVTLVAGFAGTLAYPTANVLAEMYSWHVATNFFAVLILSVAVPLFYWGTRSAKSRSAAQSQNPATASTNYSVNKLAVSSAIRRSIFWLTTASFALIMLNHNSVLTYFLPIMDDRKLPLDVAVLAVSLIGPMQVIGRIAMVLTEQWMSVMATSCLSFSCLIISSLCLLLGGDNLVAIFSFVVFQGIGIGVFSILRPLVIAHLFGYQGFGAISGIVASVTQISMAFAPTLAAAIWLLDGSDTVVLSITIMAIVSTILIYFISWSSKDTSAKKTA